jgi:alpha-L-rhamnosidase
MRLVFGLCVLLLAHAATAREPCPAELGRVSNLLADNSDYVVTRKNPVLSFALNGNENFKRFSLKHFVVTIKDTTSGESWSSGVVNSSTPTYTVPKAGSPLKTMRSYEWSVDVLTESKHSCWFTPEQTGKMHVSLAEDGTIFTGSKWLGSNETNEYTAEFQIDETKTLSAATLYIAALGFSHISINGKYLEQRMLTASPWTTSARLNGYSTIDITQYVEGRQISDINVRLGMGWRNRTLFKIHDNADPGLAQDNTDRVFISTISALYKETKDPVVICRTGSGKWSTAAGPVLSDSVYNGEVFDSRLAGAKLAWTGAQIVPGPAGALFPWVHSPVQVSRRVVPVGIAQPVKGIYVVDFGANLAGVVHLKQIDCKEGSNVTMVHGEIMQHAGIPGLPNPDPKRIYTANLRTAKATDVFICNGSPINDWYPTLTYHGFRFVEVHVGDSGVEISKENIEMLHFHSSIAQKSEVHFQSDTLNRIQKMALGAQRSNFMTVPTDCDQRDERLGWMGDANLSGESMFLNYDIAGFIRNFVFVMTSEEDVDGSIPDTVPFVRYGNRPGDVSWSGAYVNLIYLLWKHDNDVDTARTYFPQMMRQLKNVQAQAANGLNKMHTPYGDWCPPPEKMGNGQGPKPSPPFTSAYSYILMVKQLHAIANELGKSKEATDLETLYSSLTKEFNGYYYTQNSSVYDNGLQTALVLPQFLGIVPEVTRAQNALLESISGLNGHYNCGIIGFRFLFDVLFDAKKPDVALSVLSQTDYPSIGYYFANGEEPATENLWELPDALREGIGMNSRNHHMWSSYSSYLVRKVAGVSQKNNSVAFSLVELFPGTNANEFSDLSFASSTLMLKSGDLKWSWKRNGGTHCDRAAAEDEVHLDCGSGGTITKVLFASYGYPRGTVCSAFEVHESCHAVDTMNIVERKCLNKQKCDISASDTVFLGDNASGISCPNEDGAKVKKLVVRVMCSNEPELVMKASLPLGSTAQVFVPKSNTAKSIQSQESKNLLMGNDLGSDVHYNDGHIYLSKAGLYEFRVQY